MNRRTNQAYLTNEYLLPDRRRLAAAMQQRSPIPLHLLETSDKGGYLLHRKWDPLTCSEEWKSVISTFRDNARFCSTLPFTRGIEDDKKAADTLIGISRKLYGADPSIPMFTSNRDTLIERSFINFGFREFDIEGLLWDISPLLEMHAEEGPEPIIEFNYIWNRENHPDMSEHEKFIVDVCRDNDKFVATYQMVIVEDGPCRAAEEFIEWAHVLFGNDVRCE
jgi:hypothetical protein